MQIPTALKSLRLSGSTAAPVSWHPSQRPRVPWSAAYLPLPLDPSQPLSCYCLWRVSPISCLNRVPHFSSPCFLRSLLFWHQLMRVLLSFRRLTSLVDSIVVFFNFMPSVPKSYSHLRIPWKGSNSLVVCDTADVPGSYLREVAKGRRYSVHVCSASGRKEFHKLYTCPRACHMYI